ncbi:ArsR/SmtB family transcription factor [Pseudonocardia endophytica]|uniref:ArsR family transcriptional regulator n=1 Tax=Pseudonocardia endophytica TaxID=401976 RepID=A0A4R1HL53_PSEEN|nr:metalloregulator ArsR/SmtB family transcription factor [Pseudonocardia endophytica]TCK21733.1 ArsR family transcriptional regulator [Pseudonocardia endophytica]
MPGKSHDQEWADRFAVLGDLNRLRLLRLIHREGPISVGDLADRTELKPTTVSHALRVLRVYGTVDTTRDGQSRLYRLTDDTVAALLDHIPATGTDRTKALDTDP